ncbi:hypothetical protein Patl1_08300 [Pistacia atlantica]|uniref:Uncharacterized protein n=1 Tax=Pistacia atlantica TaxID=434234 RepID=A0ACC1AHP2_9ROSI|nr:hypothetical protein Patl1_08300 [Pistacia atlantica]
MASNFSITYSYEIHKVNNEILLGDGDYFTSPDALNKFRQAMPDVDNYFDSSFVQLVDSFIQNIFYKNIEPPVVLCRKREFESDNSFSLSKIEALENQKSRLQHDITNSVKAALMDAKGMNRENIQMRVILKVRKVEKMHRERENEESDCAICIEPLKEEDGSVKLLPCLHLFHQNCYRKWWWKSRFCPFCRSPLPVN